MPRNSRLDIAGCFYHVISRGVDRRRIFSDDMDRRDFLRRSRELLTECSLKCLAWCLMPNHFHMLLVRGERPLSEFMRRLMTGYAGYYNRRHERCGHLFQNRYTSILCDRDSYFREVLPYIHLNPLRAKMVPSYEALADFPWCGHREFITKTPAALADVGFALGCLAEDPGEALLKYEELMREHADKDKPGELSHGGRRCHVRIMGRPVRAETPELSDPRVLGDGNFVERVLKVEDNTPPVNVTAAEILAGVCAGTSISPADVTGPSRVRRVVDLRARYCFLAKNAGIGGDALARELGRNSGSISYLALKGRHLENNRVIVQRPL